MNRRTAGLLLSLLLPLTACSHGADPTVVPPLPSPTVAVTQSARPVEVPAAAKVHDAFGAAAFVKFYFGQVSKAFSLADPALLNGLADTACETCKEYAASAAVLRHDGQHIEGIAARVVEAEAPPEENGFVAVDLVFDAPARKLVDAAGHIVEKLPADARSHKTVFIRRAADGWVVRAVKRQP